MPNDAARATAEAMPKPMTYLDIGDSIHTARYMSDIACEMIEGAQCTANQIKGGYRITDTEMELLSFSIYHASMLINNVKHKWDEVHDSVLAARKGGDA